MLRVALMLLVVVGCAGSKRTIAAPDHEAEPAELQVLVESVGIGDPCAGQPTCAVPMIRVRLHNGPDRATVRVRSVTVTGSEGRTLTLPASKPTVFNSRGDYEPWNEMIGPEEVMDIEYSLARVDWDHFTDRADVRATSVIIEIDGRERVFSPPERRDIEVIDEEVAER